jgi:hypothetical protein
MKALGITTEIELERLVMIKDYILNKLGGLTRVAGTNTRIGNGQ